MKVCVVGSNDPRRTQARMDDVTSKMARVGIVVVPKKEPLPLTRNLEKGGSVMQLSVRGGSDFAHSQMVLDDAMRKMRSVDWLPS